MPPGTISGRIELLSILSKIHSDIRPAGNSLPEAVLSRLPCARRARRADKSLHERGDLICRRIQGEMAAVNDVNFSVGDIGAITFRFARIERSLILAPYHQQPRLLLAHPRLPLGVSIHVRPIVIKQVALYLILAGPAEKIEFIGPEI